MESPFVNKSGHECLFLIVGSHLFVSCMQGKHVGDTDWQFVAATSEDT